MQAEIRDLSMADRRVASDILSSAFASDPLMRWIIPSDSDYQRIAPAFFRQIVGQTLTAGASFTNPATEGVSLWRGPKDQLPFFSQLRSFVTLLYLLRGNLDRGMKVQQMMETYYPRKPFWHLTYLATNPERQGNGVGSLLLKPILTQAQQHRLPIYLECSNQSNLNFYHNRGFRLLDELRMPDGPTIWPMIKEL